MTAHIPFRAVLVLLLGLVIVAVSPPEAYALILGGLGNTPLRDPGWPAGAEAVFNTPARLAWWEGPPFGGGQWHAECAGDAKALSAVLANFAKLDVKAKQVVLHDGVGRSFWAKNAPMDWRFMVWQAASWQRQRRLPVDIGRIDAREAANGPPAQLDVYTGGKVKWAEVVVPRHLKIVDNRLEARGFAPADGVVIEGTVTDLATTKPILGARMRLECTDKGGYRVAQATTDIAGRWVLKKTPRGPHQVVIEADGFVPRIVGYVLVEDQPRWQAFDGGLARPARVAGRVTDNAGKPLAGVEVSIRDVTASTGEHYQSPLASRLTTGADGRFNAEWLPVGRASIWVFKTGYCRPGLGPQITTPNERVELTMIKAARLVITVDFTGKKRPAGYMVNVEPKGGAGAGKYGASGSIDAKNQLTLENVPPGPYVLRGRPNPAAVKEEPATVSVDLKGGKTTEVKLTAK
jgi:hypothetical protein